MNDYIGYIFRANSNSEFWFDDKTHGYLSYIPTDFNYKEEDYLDVSRLCFRILFEEPMLEYPCKYSASSFLLGLNKEHPRYPISYDFLQSFQPVGKFTIDKKGKVYPWVPGKNAILKPLDEKESNKTALQLIQKSHKIYLKVLGIKNIIDKNPENKSEIVWKAQTDYLLRHSRLKNYR